jgi:hypothetical protein
MSIQQRTLDNAEHIVNTKQTPALEPYDEMLLRQLISALRSLNLPKPRHGWFFLPRQWAKDGWLPLDSDGRQYLRDIGFSAIDLRFAINAGIRARVILRKTREGVSYIGLREKESL